MAIKSFEKFEKEEIARVKEKYACEDPELLKKEIEFTRSYVAKCIRNRDYDSYPMTCILTSEYSDKDFTTARDQCITLADIDAELSRLGLRPPRPETMHGAIGYDA